MDAKPLEFEINCFLSVVITGLQAFSSFGWLKMVFVGFGVVCWWFKTQKLLLGFWVGKRPFAKNPQEGKRMVLSCSLREKKAIEELDCYGL